MPREATQYSTSTDADTDPSLASSIGRKDQAKEYAEDVLVRPDEVAPPQPEEEAILSADTKRTLDLQHPQRPAKVVHLPSRDVQEERLHEREDSLRKRSVDSERAKASQVRLQTQAELASSPSSTVGAHSAATPLPPQDSPDTSPDSENGDHGEVPPPDDMRPSPEEQREKEEHDRLLAAQKDIARREALGDVSNADEQLRWEEREAASRDAEERAARENVGGLHADNNNANDEVPALHIVDEPKHDTAPRDNTPLATPPVLSTMPPAADRDNIERPSQESEDGDNITVAPRNKMPLKVDTIPVQQGTEISQQNPAHPLVRRASHSGVAQSPTGALQRDATSPMEVSPMTTRLAQDNNAVQAFDLSTAPAQRFDRLLDQRRNSHASASALDDLVALKGAAEDPERDYLEPLFRIQAHDSPHVRTTALPDLVRSASKALSTEEQFTTLHERLDYKILRRIYQLQNANKWSLRQMEKCKEPERPVTRHDHMMAEVQWMRKDFKAERQMKKSVCAWLARRCSEWIAASAEERRNMQVRVRASRATQSDQQNDLEQVPELEQSGNSATDDDSSTPAPQDSLVASSNLVIPPELTDLVCGLQKAGKLGHALEGLPLANSAGLSIAKPSGLYFNPASKFTDGKVLSLPREPSRKRSRYDYDDDADILDAQPTNKRLRAERDLAPEDQEIALFHPDNRRIRDRLHANNAFRPPSEFAMPLTQFYEFRNGSQWVWEDDQKLKRLAKEYSFNWSLISDDLQLPGSYKSSAERRTPWECFERWVELEQLPTEMKKTMYFKTWYQRLEQSQQAAERRYQAQIAALQAHSNGQSAPVPMRRRTVPTRVEKRKNTRHIWLVDGMRKLARKKEQQAYKQAECEWPLKTSCVAWRSVSILTVSSPAQRAAAQRKTHGDNNQRPGPGPKLTPQEFSRKRYEGDLRIQEAQKQQRQKFFEAQQRQILAARQAAQQGQHGMPGGNPAQQRAGNPADLPAQQAQMQPNGQPAGNMAGQMPQPGARGRLPIATQNGHLAVPQVSGQGIPQAQMRSNGQMSSAQDMQRLAQVNAQARNAQHAGQPQYQMPSSNMSPGPGGMTAQQHMQSNQAMMGSMQQQMNGSNPQQHIANHQMSAAPHMPPPPAPQQSNPQQLSSGHVPALMQVKSSIRKQYPSYSEEQVNAMATEMLKSHSQSSSQARQNAMNAAAGIHSGVNLHAPSSNMNAYANNQTAFQNNNQLPSAAAFINGDPNASQQPGMNPASPQQYAALMRQRQMHQMRMGQSPSNSHATLNGSPSLTHASPSSPNVQYASMNVMPNIGTPGVPPQQQRPPSRSATPQMQRLGSSGNMAGGMPSPQGVNGLQGSPRNMQASMAR